MNFFSGINKLIDSYLPPTFTKSFESINPLESFSVGVQPEASHITKLNQTKHEFEIYLDNNSKNADSSIYPINPNSIVNLIIEDTMSDWVTRGTLTFLYNPEFGGKLNINPATGQRADVTDGLVNVRETPGYMFRCDGNDFLRIRIKPFVSADYNDALKITDPVHWTISHLFSIYDMEDIDLPPGAQNQASSVIKCIKLYFWDSWYQKMISNVMEYSTALSPEANIEADIAEGKYSNPGTIFTGQAIKEIIELSLQEKSTQEGYTGSTVVDPFLKFNYEPTKDDNWDEGKTKIFYTAPADATAYESLTYLLKRHVSSVGTNELYDFCVLSKEKGPTETDFGQFKLEPMSSIFQKAGNALKSPGKFQIEHFFLQSYTNTDVLENKEVPSKNYRGPIGDGSSDTVDLQTQKYGIITSYRFVDIAPHTNTFDFTNKPVYSVDFKNRTFNVEFQKNSVKSARDFMAKQYISGVYKNDRASLEDLFLINLDTDKTNRDVHPQFSLHGDDPDIRQHTGLTKLLKTGIFLNTAINFRTLGLTSRQAGRFIAIDKTQGVDPGDFPDKFYGQWFIINIKHIIESEIYYNDITAIKIHRFNKPETQLNNTI
jgi:hypothetical protein